MQSWMLAYVAVPPQPDLNLTSSTQEEEPSPLLEA
jgi:hypothetical protein